MRKSLQLSFTAVFSALHAVLYLVSFGLWRNWGIYMEAVEGIILGPRIGFLAALLGSSIGRMIKPDPLSWMFGIIAEPISVFTAGLLARGTWKPLLAYYSVMVLAYFIHPFGRALPIWTILDILVGLALIYPASKLGKNLFGTNLERLPIALVLVSFICIATDSLVRVFLLVPCGLYGIFSPSFEGVYAMFVGAAVDSYIEDLLVVAVSLIVGVPVLMSLSKLKLIVENRKK
jgi:uncharacterized membrane protein